MEALLLLGKTLFILLILGGGALVFSKDANRLVLIPIDRMVQRIKNIAENPRLKPDEDASLPVEAADTEMRILEASIDKISELLGVAFGDAGVDIISANMRCMGGLNPMVPGHRTVRALLLPTLATACVLDGHETVCAMSVHKALEQAAPAPYLTRSYQGIVPMQVAIFGFCDIRNFTDITETLQEGVMSFVNTIAEIVHSEVHGHNGSANKNIGDAFLLVWKFREGFTCALGWLV